MPADRPVSLLSPREQQLLRLAAKGSTDTAIADELGISEATVGTYWGRVRIKFGPYSRTELVAIMLGAESETAFENLRSANAHVLADLQIHLNSGTAIFARDLIELAPDATMLISIDGQIEYANQATCEVFGYKRGELEGQRISILVPDRFRERHIEYMQTYANDPSRRMMGQHLNTPALHSQGAEFEIRASLSTVTLADRTIFMCSIRAA